jgi:uncharacterized membrane protein YkoI
MKHSFLVGSAATSFCLGLLLALPICALARESSELPVSPAAREYSESERAAISEEIKAFANVPVSIRDAIAIAEKRIAGTRVVDVSFDGRADNLVYKIKAHLGDKTWNGTIDASTGKIMGDGIVAPVSSLDAKDKTELDDFTASGVFLSDAVKIAEQSTAGRAVSAGLGEADGALSFLVVVVADGSLKEVSIAADQEANRIDKLTVGRTKKRRLDHNAR